MADINCKITLSVPALEKFVEILCKGIGRWYSPIDVRRMAKAKACEISVISEALRENADVPAVYDNGEIVLDTQNFGELMKRAHQRMTYQELVKQNNIESVIGMAYQAIGNEEKVTDEPVDEDWILRFFNSVQDVSSAEMQRIWAGILAGEIRRPSSFSLRTLETLHNISKDEAELFQRIHKYIIKNGKKRYIPNEDVLLQNAGINYSDIVRLEECGLINADSNLAIENEEAHHMALAHNNKYVVFATAKNKFYLKVRVFPLTRVGCEIESLFNTDTEYKFLVLFAQEMRKKYPSIDIKMHPIKSINENIIEYDERIDLLSDDETIG